MEIDKVNEILNTIILHKSTDGALDKDSALESLAVAMQHIAESVHKIETTISSSKGTAR